MSPPRPEALGDLRLRFDPDHSRESVSRNRKMKMYAMKLHTDDRPGTVKGPATIVRDFTVFADGEEICRVEGNYLSLLRIPIRRTTKEIRIRWDATNGADAVNLFGADFTEIR